MLDEAHGSRQAVFLGDALPKFPCPLVDATAFRRRISAEVQRQALAVVLIATALVSTGTVAVQAMTAAPLDRFSLRSSRPLAPWGSRPG
jgi:hypothetical protein